MRRIEIPREREKRLFSLHTTDSPEVILENIRRCATQPLPDDLEAQDFKNPFEPEPGSPHQTEISFMRNADFGSAASILVLRNLTDAIKAAYPRAFCHDRHQFVEGRGGPGS